MLRTEKRERRAPSPLLLSLSSFPYPLPLSSYLSFLVKNVEYWGVYVVMYALLRNNV
jgi:hypothetical protein